MIPRAIRSTLVLSAIMLGLAAGLAGCGKKGAPHAPGPADRITYPAVYPPE